MLMAVDCPHCAARFRAREELAGRSAKCPKCANPFQLAPAAGTPSAKEPQQGRPSQGESAIATAPPTSPADAGATPQKRAVGLPSGPTTPPLRAAAASQLLNGLKSPVKRARTPVAYQGAAVIVALLMIMLPMVYVGLIAAVGYGVYLHAVYDIGMLTNSPVRGRGVILVFLAYAAPIIAGVIAVVFMIKPLFARPAKEVRQRSLRREAEPLLFEFVDHVCDAVSAPRPKRIDVDCQVNASASFRRGLLSMLGNDLVLTIGLPLAAGLNARQFAGVLAHEFGHFSQGFGMRLTYLIRSLNAWFMRVVYERDRWDAALEQSAAQVDFRIGWVLYAAMGCVWLSRRILSALMHVGHFFGSHLLRQMEFDADRYEVRLAGAKAFEQTVRQLHVLNFASQGAFDDLRQLYQEGRLVDDLPRLIMARVDSAPDQLGEKIDEIIAGGKTHWFDTHPSDADRIAAARREGGAGVFHVELPASTLFADFEAQSQATTWEFYRGLFGNKVDRSQLQPVSAVEARHEATRQSNDALEKFFRGEWHVVAPLPVGGVFLSVPDKPQSVLEELKAARGDMERLAPSVRGAEANLSKVLQRASEALQMQACLRANLKPGKDAMKKWGDQSAVDKAARAVPQDFERAVGRLEQWNAAAARRVVAALTLAYVPKVAGRMKPQPSDTAIESQFDALRTLGEQLPGLVTLSHYHAALDALVGVLQQGGDADDLEPVIRQLMGKLQPPAAQMRNVMQHCKYPFDHAKGQISLAQFVMPDMPIANDLASIYNGVGQALQHAPALYVRVLGELISTVAAVEAACGLTSPPESA